MTIRTPFDTLDALRQEIDRAFGDYGFGSRRAPWRVAFLPGRAARQYPLVNVHDDGNDFVIEALAPGVDPAALDVSIVRNQVTLSGEKARAGEVKPERIHRTERAAGRFVRTVELPTEVDPDKVTADYTNGLLVVRLPKAETARPRKVQIQSR